MEYRIIDLYVESDEEPFETGRLEVKDNNIVPKGEIPQSVKVEG